MSPCPLPQTPFQQDPALCPSQRVPPHSLTEQLTRAAVGSTRAVHSNAQASLERPSTATAPGRPACDTLHPPMTSGHVIGGLTTPAGRWQS